MPKKDSFIRFSDLAKGGLKARPAPKKKKRAKKAAGPSPRYTVRG